MTAPDADTREARSQLASAQPSIGWRAWWVGLGCAAACLAWPSWPPSTDLPAHIALIEVLHHLGEGGAIDRHFTTGVFPAPNSALYGIGYVLRLAFEPQTTARILFVGAGLAVPLGWAAFARATQPPQRALALAWLGVPMVFAWPQMEGLLDWQLGCGLMLWTFALWIRAARTDARRGWNGALHHTPGRATLALAGLAALVFLTHVQACLLLGLVVLAVLIAPPERARSIHWRPALAIGAVTVALALTWYLQVDLGLRGEGAGARWVGPVRRLQGLQLYTLDLREGIVGIGLVFGYWGAVAAVVLLDWLAARRSRHAHCLADVPKAPLQEASTCIRARRTVVAFSSLVLACYFLAPLSWGYYAGFAWRMAPLVTLLVAGLALGRGSGPKDSWSARWSWTVPAVGFALMCAVWMSVAVEWERYNAGFDGALGALPKESRVAVVVGMVDAPPTSWGFDRFAMWRHLGQYHTAINQGTTLFSFGFHPGRVALERDSYYGGSPPDFVALDDLHTTSVLDDVDAILALSDVPLEERHPARLELVYRVDWWSVYRVRAESTGE